MPARDDTRRDVGLSSVAHVGDDAERSSDQAAIDAALRRARRKNPVRPAERRRRARVMTVTFSDPELTERLRALAFEWGWLAPNGQDPNASAVVEALVLLGLEAVEAGHDPPERPGEKR